jgi:hypothetical protein
MRLRDRLAHLSSPTAATPRAPGAGAGASAHASTQPASPDPGVDPDSRRSPFELRHDDRAASIAQLRDLIGQVAAREARSRARVPVSTDDDIAPHWDGDSSQLPAREHAAPCLPLGTLQDSPHGTLRVLERWLDPQHCHGRTPVRDALRVQIFQPPWQPFLRPLRRAARRLNLQPTSTSP